MKKGLDKVELFVYTNDDLTGVTCMTKKSPMKVCQRLDRNRQYGR